MDKDQEELNEKKQRKLAKAKLIGINAGMLAIFLVGLIGLLLIPKPYGQIAIVIIIVGVAVFYLIRRISTNKQEWQAEMGIEKLPTERQLKKIEETERFIKQLEAEERELTEKYALNSQSIVMMDVWGKIYQCIKQHDMYYFIHIGNQLSGIKKEKMISDFSDSAKFMSDKKDFTMEKSQVTSMLYNQPNTAMNPWGAGTITIKMNGKKKHFNLSCDEPTLKSFFDGAELQQKKKKAEKYSAEESEVNENVDGKRYYALKNALAILNFIIIISSAIFLFLGLSYIVVSAVLILCFVAAFVLYSKYSDVFTLSELKSNKGSSRKKLFIFVPFIAPPIVLAIRALLDFRFLEWTNFFIYSAVAFVVVAILFFVFTKEYRKSKPMVAGILAISLLFSMAFVPNVNFNLDFKDPLIIQSDVYDMKTSSSSNTPTQYIIEIKTSKGKVMQLEISKELYEKLEIGDIVDVHEHGGFLGIPYAFAYEHTTP